MRSRLRSRADGELLENPVFVRGISGTKVPPPVHWQWHFSATAVWCDLIYLGSTSRMSGCFFQSGTGVLQPARGT
jgi:hypothetical protein